MNLNAEGAKGRNMQARRSKPISRKAKNERVTPEFIAGRVKALADAGFAPSKWLGFCEAMLAAGLRVSLYEAKQTRSKYLTISRKGSAHYRVRFSNHPPARAKEIGGDCDFFVGRTNLAVTTTDQAIAATLRHFEIAEPAEVPA